MLVVVLLAATIVMIRKRNQRNVSLIDSATAASYIHHREKAKKKRKGGIEGFHTDENGIEISSPLEPWTTNQQVKSAFPNLIKSNAWFDSLQR